MRVHCESTITRPAHRTGAFFVVFLVMSLPTAKIWGLSTTENSGCQIQPITFEGWRAQELSNQWVRVTIVPQLGGRVMQVEFAGHPYLFVNPRFRGQYISPEQAANSQRWINYGGDKIWPMPEGNEDASHWPGPRSDALDDGNYQFSIVNQNSTCKIRLRGPADPFTGLRFTREITVGSNSPEILFHAEMANASNQPIRWSVQSVTQYDTADSQDSSRYNNEFWAFAPIKAHSIFVDGYRVRAGLADDPSFSVQGGWFRLHWLYLENEVWLDSDAGWIAVIDGKSHFGMIENFRYLENTEYPGDASVIFYKNGGALQLDKNGMPQLRSSDPQVSPFYMEAELNSPMATLQPGQSSGFETSWHPVRASKNLESVTRVGVIEQPLTATIRGTVLRVVGTFGIFFPGRIVARIRNHQGSERQVDLGPANPELELLLDKEIPGSSKDIHIELHVIDTSGAELGMLAETDAR